MASNNAYNLLSPIIIIFSRHLFAFKHFHETKQGKTNHNYFRTHFMSFKTKILLVFFSNYFYEKPKLTQTIEKGKETLFLSGINHLRKYPFIGRYFSFFCEVFSFAFRVVLSASLKNLDKINFLVMENEFKNFKF